MTYREPIHTTKEELQMILEGTVRLTKQESAIMAKIKANPSAEQLKTKIYQELNRRN